MVSAALNSQSSLTHSTHSVRPASTTSRTSKPKLLRRFTALNQSLDPTSIKEESLDDESRLLGVEALCPSDSPAMLLTHSEGKVEVPAGWGWKKIKNSGPNEKKGGRERGEGPSDSDSDSDSGSSSSSRHSGSSDDSGDSDAEREQGEETLLHLNYLWLTQSSIA